MIIIKAIDTITEAACECITRKYDPIEDTQRMLTLMVADGRKHSRGSSCRETVSLRESRDLGASEHFPPKTSSNIL